MARPNFPGMGGNVQQLMKQVNRVIGLCIGAEEHNEPDSDEEEEGACNGCCSHCTGCTH